MHQVHDLRHFSVCLNYVLFATELCGSVPMSAYRWAFLLTTSPTFLWLFLLQQSLCICDLGNIPAQIIWTVVCMWLAWAFPAFQHHTVLYKHRKDAISKVYQFQSFHLITNGEPWSHSPNARSLNTFIFLWLKMFAALQVSLYASLHTEREITSAPLVCAELPIRECWYVVASFQRSDKRLHAQNPN